MNSATFRSERFSRAPVNGGSAHICSTVGPARCALLVVVGAIAAPGASRATDTEWTHLATNHHWFPHAEVELISHKYMSADGTQVARFCTDGSGVPVEDCGDQLYAQERELRRQLFGSVSDELAEAMLGEGDSVVFPVALWLPVWLDHPPKEELLADGDLALAVRQKNEARIAAARDAAVKLLSDAGVTSWVAEPSAPVIYADLDVTQISELMDDSSIADMFLQKVPVPGGTTYVTTIGSDTATTDGGSQVTCVVEQSQPQTPNSLPAHARNCIGGTTNSHARCVAGVIRSSASPDGGVASGATLITASWDGCNSNAALSFDWCRDQNAVVWNWSHTCSSTDQRLIDYYVKQDPYPLVSVLAGNSSGCPWCVTHNAITVGASDEQGTSSRTDDTIASFSCWANPSSGHDDFELPQIVAPGVNIDADGDTTCGSGTSFASPMVAGAAAHVFDRNSSLVYWPEAARAIIMTTAFSNVDGGVTTLDEATFGGTFVDDKDGVGMLSVARASVLASSANHVTDGSVSHQIGYAYGSMSSTQVPRGQCWSETFAARVSVGSQTLRAVLTWDGTATCTGTPASSCSANSLDADLDLFVKRADGTTLADSVSWDNPFEFVEVAVAANTTYTIQICASYWTASSTYWGLAWYIGTVD